MKALALVASLACAGCASVPDGGYTVKQTIYRTEDGFQVVSESDLGTSVFDFKINHIWTSEEGKEQ